MNRFALNGQYKLIVLGGSAGSFQIVTKILSQLPEDFSIPIAMCLHRLRHVRNGFVEALSIKSKLPIVEPVDKGKLKQRQVYLAPANYHMGFELSKTFTLTTDDLLNNSRPSIDIMMETAAHAFREKVVGILLSGANKDGAVGMQKVSQKGGLTIVQHPEECLIDTMPKAALKIANIDHQLTVDEIISFLKMLDESVKENV